MKTETLGVIKGVQDTCAGALSDLAENFNSGIALARSSFEVVMRAEREERIQDQELQHSLGTNLSFPAWYIANTLHVHGQCTHAAPTQCITSTFNIFQTGFFAVFLVSEMPGTFTVFHVM